MKYMLLMHARTDGSKDWQTLMAWAPEDVQAMREFMHGLNKGLTESGELVDAQGLAGPDQARIVRAQDGGAPVVTDGPFAEAKEFLAGYWIVDCESLERATEIAARASAAPGPGGVPLNMKIELRQVMEASGEEM